jgi:hypothetical protein
VRTGALERIYDFTARRLIEIDHEKKTFSEHSLYALPVFMARERQNRIVLNDVFRQTLGSAKNQSVHVAPGIIISISTSTCSSARCRPRKASTRCGRT